MGAVGKDILFRAYIIYVIVLIMAIIIVVRMFSLIFVNGEEYREMAEENLIREKLEIVQLKETVLEQYPHELSGGMRQRAAASA